MGPSAHCPGPFKLLNALPEYRNFQKSRNDSQPSSTPTTVTYTPQQSAVFEGTKSYSHMSRKLWNSWTVANKALDRRISGHRVSVMWISENIDRRPERLSIVWGVAFQNDHPDNTSRYHWECSQSSSATASAFGIRVSSLPQPLGQSAKNWTKIANLATLLSSDKASAASYGLSKWYFVQGLVAPWLLDEHNIWTAHTRDNSLLYRDCCSRDPIIPTE